MRIITGCAWILLHSDYAFNGSPTGHHHHHHHCQRVNWVNRALRHLPIEYRDSVSTLVPSFSINIRGGHRANFAINTKAFVAGRVTKISEISARSNARFPLELYTSDRIYFNLARGRRNNSLEQQLKCHLRNSVELLKINITKSLKDWRLNKYHTRKEICCFDEANRFLRN